MAKAAVDMYEPSGHSIVLNRCRWSALMKLEEKEILRKKRVLVYAEACGNVLKTCRHFGVSRSNFYIWRAAYRRQGNAGLVRKKPIARSHPNQTPAEVVEKVLYL